MEGGGFGLIGDLLVGLIGAFIGIGCCRGLAFTLASNCRCHPETLSLRIVLS